MKLEIYLGPMFAGKTSMIIRLVNRYKNINKRFCLVSHKIDNRYSETDYLINHDLMGIPCERWAKLMDFSLNSQFMSSSLIIIDEAQFFPDLREFVLLAEKLNKHVILFGLDGDTERKPFGQILDCIPLADEVIKLKAFCKVCNDGSEALFTYTSMKKTEQVCVGGAETYASLCRAHYLEFTGSVGR